MATDDSPTNTDELSAFAPQPSPTRPLGSPDGGEDGWSSHGSGRNDVGYSSGENSVHEALNTLR